MEIVDSKRTNSIIKNILHFYNENIFVDVVIVVGEKRIPGHKLVLAAACDYFKNKFRESTELIIDNVDDVSTSAIEDVINYIYTGKINLKHVGEILKFLKHIGYHHLEELIMKYLIRNFSEITRKEFFVDIPLDILTTLINSEKLYVEQEKIFDGIRMWIFKDFNNRQEHLYIFLKSMKLYNFSEYFLFTKVLPLCRRHSIDVLQLFVDSLMWLREPALRENITFTSTRNKRNETLLIVDENKISNFHILDDEVYTWRSLSVNITEKAVYSSDVFDGKIYIWTDHKKNSFKSTVIDLKDHSARSYEYNYNNDCDVRDDMAFFYRGEFYVYRCNLGFIEKWHESAKIKITDVDMTFEIDMFFICDTKLVMFGFKESEDENVMRLKIYDFTHNKWIYEFPMRARTEFVTAIIDDFLYIIGGFIYDDCTTMVERVNLNTGKWTYVEDLPRTCEIKGSVIYNGKIICVGTDPNCILEYDPDDNEWHELPLPISRKLSDPKIFRIPPDFLPASVFGNIFSQRSKLKHSKK